jgi:hypothetical protein
MEIAASLAEKEREIMSIIDELREHLWEGNADG